MELKNGEKLIANRSESGRQRYKLFQNGREVPLTGVTTVVGVIDKPFLVAWAAKLAYEDSEKIVETSIDKYEALKKIKKVIKDKLYAHEANKKGAADKGTDAHDYVERFVQHYIDHQEYFVTILDEIDDEAMFVCVKRFIEWACENNVEFLACETSVFNGNYYFAGSFDFICKIGDKTYMGDFKTSSSIQDTYFAQCAGYISAVRYVQEVQGTEKYKFDGIVIVKSSKEIEDKEYWVKGTTGAKKQVIPAFEVQFNYDIENQIKFFLACLFLYRFKSNQSIREFVALPEPEEPEPYHDNEPIS